MRLRRLLAAAAAVGLTAWGCCTTPMMELDAAAPDGASGRDGGLPRDDAAMRDASHDGDAGPPPEPYFVEVAAEAGLAVTHGAQRSPPDCLFDDALVEGPGDHCDAEHAIAGVAVADYDLDGDPDLFLTRVRSPGSLYENAGDGTFRDVTDALGVRVDEPTSGAAFGDVDRDGDVDLYVTVLGGTRHRLFLREGATFVERGVERGAALTSALPLLGTTPVLGDYDLDGDLDLYVGEWRDRRSVHDGPSMARLLRNRGPAMPGHFEDVTAAAGVSMEDAYEGVAMKGVYVYGAGILDVDGDAIPDLAIGGDFYTSRLFFGRGDGTFEDATVAAGVGTESNAMGTSFGDVDGDGDLDWLVTSIWMLGGLDSGNRLYVNEGARRFREIGAETGMRNAGWAWGTALFDYDNDGDLDAVATNGWRFPDWAADPMRLWRNEGALTFSERAAAEGLSDTGQGRGLVVLDYDVDGDLDVLVARHGDVPLLYRNERGAERAWLRVRVRGRASATDGTGARVMVQTSAGGATRTAVIGTSSFLGHGEQVAHFGLGDHETPVDRVEVLFPSGARAVVRDVAVRRTIEVVEP